MIWGFGRQPERPGPAPEMKESREEEGPNVAERALDSTLQLREKASLLDRLSKEARVLRMGALFVGLMVPAESLAYGPEERVTELNELIRDLNEDQRDLQQDLRRYQQQGRSADIARTERLLAQSEAKEARIQTALDNTLARVEAKQVREHVRTEAVVAGQNERRGESDPVSSIGLYRLAPDAVDAYMEQGHIEEFGRSMVVVGADGQEQFIDVPHTLNVEGFDHRGNDLTIIFKNIDETYHGMFFDNGLYVGEGPVNKRGAKLPH